MTSASTVPLPMGSTEHVFPARPVMLREIRAFIARLATAAGIPETDQHRIVLATNEAATNAVEHSGSDVVRVGWEHGDQGVWITVADDGVFGAIAGDDLSGRRQHSIAQVAMVVGLAHTSELTTGKLPVAR